jgi:hypothetical protein
MSALKVTRHRFWSPPTVERAVGTLLSTVAVAQRADSAFQRDKHFRLVRLERGAERHDLPIWATLQGAIAFSLDAWGPVRKSHVPGVPGAFVLSNVLTDAECEQVASLSEAMGYTEDAPVSLDRRIRQNENCVLIAHDTLWTPIWQRVHEHMPPRVAGGAPVGLNQRWRLCECAHAEVLASNNLLRGLAV